ncbi:MAG: bifunctional demethylmenaquinone methyltransferase/2-methoxy-6-polyprenyl-1,4-benzoquinol methylase UbiE [Bryobacteraceae bacterium]
MRSAPAPGATPPAIAGDEDAARWVRAMFARVARRYDLLNHLLSFNLDRHWRARAVRRLRPVLARPGARVADLCCGTGDLMLALAAAARGGRVYGSDFCHPMLAEAARKAARKRAPIGLIEADALALPLAAGSLDLLTMAFGFRNLASYAQGLSEMRRVLKPGGVAAILEFSAPRNRVFAAIYAFYSGRVLPAAGGAVSGDAEAYRYLPESVRKFPAPDELAEMMRAAGFTQVRYERMTGGIVALHTGTAV